MGLEPLLFFMRKLICFIFIISVYPAKILRSGDSYLLYLMLNILFNTRLKLLTNLNFHKYLYFYILSNCYVMRLRISLSLVYF